METLRMNITCVTLRDLAELESAENMTDVTLCWQEGSHIKDFFPVLKRWRKLRRLRLQISENSRNNIFPQFEVFSDFIMETKNLSYLCFYDRSNDGQLEILREKVNELILPRRPNFKFDIFHD